MMMSRFAPWCSLLVCAAVAGPTAAPVVVPAPAREVTRPAVIIAGADFPFQLQGLFGRGDETQAGLRERATGKSHWVAKGEKVGDYTLESVDAVTGVAVLSRRGIRHRLRLAGASSPGVGAGAKADPEKNAHREKVLVNDARQLCSAFNQYCSENNVKAVELGKLRQSFSGNSLSAGTRITVDNGATEIDFADRAADRLVLTAGGSFVLSTEGYDKSISENRKLRPEGMDAKDTPGGAHAIVFSADTGSATE